MNALSLKELIKKLNSYDRDIRLYESRIELIKESKIEKLVFYIKNSQNFNAYNNDKPMLNLIRVEYIKHLHKLIANRKREIKKISEYISNEY